MITRGSLLRASIDTPNRDAAEYQPLVSLLRASIETPNRDAAEDTSHDTMAQSGVTRNDASSGQLRTPDSIGVTTNDASSGQVRTPHSVGASVRQLRTPDSIGGDVPEEANVDGGSSVGSRFSQDAENVGESEKSTKKRKRSPKSSKLNPKIAVRPGPYPVTFRTQIIEEMLKGSKGSNENSTKRQNFTRILIDGKPAPFLLEKKVASDLASQKLIKVPKNDTDEASNGDSVNPGNGTEDNSISTIFRVLKEKDLKITLQCPACDKDENDNWVRCKHQFTICPDMWKAMFLKKDSNEPSCSTLPDKDGIWEHTMMTRKHLTENGMKQNAPSHFMKMLTKHIAIKKGEHVDKCMKWTCLENKITTAKNDFGRNVEDYRMMQFNYILAMQMPLIRTTTVTRSMREKLGAIDTKELDTDQKEWANFIEKTKCDISKGKLTVTAEEKFQLIAENFQFDLVKITLCNLCREETILYNYEEGKAVPANARMICGVCKTSEGIACRGCLKQNHERNRWSSNLRDGINVQDTSQCPFCRSTGQFEEGVLPPLLGNDDLKLWVEELNDTHREVHKDLSATIAAKKVCETMQKKYLAETQKSVPIEAALRRHETSYRQHYDKVTTSLSLRSIKLRTRHHIDNFAARLAYIINYFEGETSDADERLLKSVTNKQTQLAGIMTQYITEFERGPYVWRQGHDALTQEEAIPQNGARENQGSRNTDGVEVIEIVDDE